MSSSKNTKPTTMLLPRWSDGLISVSPKRCHIRALVQIQFGPHWIGQYIKVIIYALDNAHRYFFLLSLID